MKKCILLMGWLCITTITFSQTVYTVETIPNPKSADNSYVSNPDQVLSDTTVRYLNLLLRTLEDSTTSQVAVVVVNSIGDAVPGDFKTELFRYWGIGQKSNNNGLLILLVMDQHRIEFETGYGLEGILTDAMCKQIQVEYMVPLAREGEFNDCVMAGVYQVIQILMDPAYRDEVYAYSANIYDSTPWWRQSASNILLILFAFVFGTSALASYGSATNRLKKAPAYVKNNYNRAYATGKFILLDIAAPGAFYIWQQSIGHLRVFEFWSFVYALIMVLLLEKRLRINRYIVKDTADKGPQETYNILAKSHSNGWLAASIFFPIPFIFYSLLNNMRMKRFRNTAPLSADGKTPMVKLDEIKDDGFLKAFQLTEENLKSVDYDVWRDPTTNNYKIFRFENYFSKYKECPNCHAKAFFMTHNQTLVSPTYESSGEGMKTYTCKACNHVKTEKYTIAKLTRSSSSGSGGGGFSGGGGGGFGGGSSGGGGAGSSW